MCAACRRASLFGRKMSGVWYTDGAAAGGLNTMRFAPVAGACVRKEGCGGILSAFFVRDVVDCCRRATTRATQQVAVVVVVAVVCKLARELMGRSSDQASILLFFFFPFLLVVAFQGFRVSGFDVVGRVGVR